MAQPHFTTSRHNDYLRNLRELMQEAVRQTQKFDAQWNDINEKLNAKYKAERVTDIVQLTKLKSASIPLNDALQAGMWWRDKATYLATVIQAEIAMRREGL